MGIAYAFFESELSLEKIENHFKEMREGNTIPADFTIFIMDGIEKLNFKLINEISDTAKNLLKQREVSDNLNEILSILSGSAGYPPRFVIEADYAFADNESVALALMSILNSNSENKDFKGAAVYKKKGPWFKLFKEEFVIQQI